MAKCKDLMGSAVKGLIQKTFPGLIPRTPLKGRLGGGEGKGCVTAIGGMDAPERGRQNRLLHRHVWPTERAATKQHISDKCFYWRFADKPHEEQLFDDLSRNGA